MRNFIFLDNYALNNPGPYSRPFLYRVKAVDEDDAWRKFAKFARTEFGLKKDASAESIREEYEDSIILYDADLRAIDLPD